MFTTDERRLLLSTPGIGPGVIGRLESAGISSLAQLDEIGADLALKRVCQIVGSTGWANRRGALLRALQAARFTQRRQSANAQTN